MENIKVIEIRKIATQLKNVSVSSNGNPNTPITKRDLEKFRDKVADAITAIANILED